MRDSCVLFIVTMVKKGKWDEEGLYGSGLCCARILMVALAALAPLSMNIQSDALPMHCHT